MKNMPSFSHAFLSCTLSEGCVCKTIGLDRATRQQWGVLRGASEQEPGKVGVHAGREPVLTLRSQAGSGRQTCWGVAQCGVSEPEQSKVFFARGTWWREDFSKRVRPKQGEEEQPVFENGLYERIHVHRHISCISKWEIAAFRWKF